MKIALAVCQFLEYDPELDEMLDKDPREWDKDLIQRLNRYDKQPLTQSLIGTMKGKGTCVSYSYIFAAACMKLGIDAYEVSGYSNPEKDLHHSWNHVRINGEEVPIDLLAIDNSVAEKWNVYHNYLAKYEEKASRGEFDDEIMDTFCETVFVKYVKTIEEQYETVENRVDLFLPKDEYLTKQKVTYYNNAGNLHFYEVNYNKALFVYVLYGILPAVICLMILIVSKKDATKGLKTNETKKRES